MRQTRILSVVIEHYADSAWNLDGVHNDGDKMFAVFRDLFSIADENYTLLRDSSATQVNLQSTFIHLLEATKDGDTAIFYYSGHGVRLPIKMTNDPSEADLKDDALFPYESKTSTLVIDNWIGAAVSLHLNPMARFIAIIDACHSGTILKVVDPFMNIKTKEVPFDKIKKDLPLELLRHDALVNAKAQSSLANLPIVQLSAAEETQQAIVADLPGGTRGSVFTHALVETLRNAPADSTWAQLQGEIVRRVKKLTDVHQPKIVFYGGAGASRVFPIQ